MAPSFFQPAACARHCSGVLSSTSSQVSTPDLAGVPAGLADVAPELLDLRRTRLVRREEREPAVADPSGAPEHGVGMAAEPDGDGLLNRERVQAGVGNLVVLPLEGDEFVGPEQAHDLDLLLDAPRAVAEVHAEGFVFHVVPADRHAEPESPFAEHVERRRLLGHQRGLTLRQDDDAGDELEPLGDSSQEPEQHEGFMKRVGVLVRAPELVRGRVAAEHVVEGKDMLVPQRLGRLPVVANDCGIVADLGLWKNDAKLHSGPPSLTVVRAAGMAAAHHAIMPRQRGIVGPRRSGRAPAG